MLQISQGEMDNLVAFPDLQGEAIGKTLSPAAMAGHLRRLHPLHARCFAVAMHEDAAWANESWGRFWASVVQLV